MTWTNQAGKQCQSLDRSLMNVLTIPVIFLIILIGCGLIVYEFIYELIESIFGRDDD